MLSKKDMTHLIYKSTYKNVWIYVLLWHWHELFIRYIIELNSY